MIRRKDDVNALRRSCMLALALGCAHAAGAQQFGRIEGVVTDSVHSKPLPDAIIYVTRDLPAQPEFFRTLVSDKEGRYRLDSLMAGRYTVSFTHALLDSLDLLLPPREVALAGGEHARIDFAIPSGTTLRLRACPALQLAPETGAVVGRVTNAETDRPLIGASVVITWNDITVDRTTLRAASVERAGTTRVDADGMYRLCGVPTGSVLLLQVQTNGRAGSALRTEVPDDVGVTVLDLSFSAKASRALSASDTAKTELLKGTATLTGTVRSSTGAPVSDVLLRVVDAAGSARTDSLGRFSFVGLPAGSQLLEARRIGFLIGRRTVDLRSGRTIDVQLRLARIVSLDSVRIVAQRGRYKEFEQHRHAAFARFLTEDQIAERHALETVDLLYGIPGFRVIGRGFDAKIASSRGSSFRGACQPNVVIDNARDQEIYLVRPNDIGAMEIYSDGIGGPPGANRGCGVIVIWTKR